MSISANLCKRAGGLFFVKIVDLGCMTEAMCSKYRNRFRESVTSVTAVKGTSRGGLAHYHCTNAGDILHFPESVTANRA